jgi:predicted HD phosphohydrolase
MSLETVSFIAMADGTAEDYALLDRCEERFMTGLVDRVLDHLKLLQESYGGYKIDRYHHSLQTATRAQRAGADEETIVAALLHDIGDTIAPSAHGPMAAAVLSHYVSPETAWMVEKHPIFQGYHYFHHYGLDRNQREKFRGHPAFERTCRFCDEWDQTAFDPNYDTLPLDTFTPLVRRIFATPRWRLG